MALTLREGQPEDLPLIAARARAEELDSRQARPEQFVVAELTGETVGFGRLIEHPDGWEVACLWVAPAWRRRGVGRQMVGALLERAADGAPVYAVAAVPRFFQALGFVPSPEAPCSIAAKHQFCCREYEAETVIMQYRPGGG